MAHTTVRITEEARDLLRELAEDEGVSMQVVLGRAIEIYRRRRFLEEVNAGFARLREEPGAWQTHDADGQTSDATIADGLPADEVWTDDGRVVEPSPRERRKAKGRRRR
jgi:predicted transcriptional regulator